MCGLLPGSWGDSTGLRIVKVWKSLGINEPVDDIQRRCREVWDTPYVPLPDDRTMIHLKG